MRGPLLYLCPLSSSQTSLYLLPIPVPILKIEGAQMKGSICQFMIFFFQER